MLEACLTPSFKHFGGNVMIWRSIGDKVGDLYRVKGILKEEGYHSILQRHAIPCGWHIIGVNFLLQQDNDPKHSSKLCNNYLGKKQSAGILSIMEWPAQSLDLNPTELLWEQLDHQDTLEYGCQSHSALWGHILIIRGREQGDFWIFRLIVMYPQSHYPKDQMNDCHVSSTSLS